MLFENLSIEPQIVVGRIGIKKEVMVKTNRPELENMVLAGPGQAGFEKRIFEGERSKKYPRVPVGTGKFEGQVAIITGAAGGQGEIEAKMIAQQGASVVLVDINEKDMQRVQRDIERDGGTCMSDVMDVSVEKNWINLIQKVVKAYGRIDLLVNNAGIIDNGGALNIELDSFHKVMNVDCTGVLLGVKHCSQEMIKVGGGAIVSTSSIYGAHFGPANCIAYATAKAAVVGMSRAQATDLAEYGIRVNVVHPGHILTPLTYARPANREKLANAALQKRYGLSEEVAAPVVFLLSDDASHITGQCLYIDGGMTVFLNTANKQYG